MIFILIAFSDLLSKNKVNSCQTLFFFQNGYTVDTGLFISKIILFPLVFIVIFVTNLWTVNLSGVFLDSIQIHLFVFLVLIYYFNIWLHHLHVYQSSVVFHCMPASIEKNHREYKQYCFLKENLSFCLLESQGWELTTSVYERLIQVLSGFHLWQKSVFFGYRLLP